MKGLGREVLKVAADGAAGQVDIGRATGHQVRDRPSGAGRQGPAQMAVAQVDREVADRRPAQHRDAVRGGRPESGPVLPRLRVRQAREQLQQAVDQLGATAGIGDDRRGGL